MSEVSRRKNLLNMNPHEGEQVSKNNIESETQTEYLSSHN